MAKNKNSESSLDIFGNMQKLNGKSSVETKNEGLNSKKTLQTFHVTFLNDTEVFKEFDVTEEEPLTYPEDIPSKASDTMFQYHFKGWDKTPSTVTEDTIIHAEYEKEALTFEVKFLLDGSVIYAENVTYGNLPTAPSYPIEKEDDETYHYTFLGWEPSLSIPITAPAVFTATFQKTELPKPEPVIENPVINNSINTVEDVEENVETIEPSNEPNENVANPVLTETTNNYHIEEVEPAAVKETDNYTAQAMPKETVNPTAPVKAKVGRPATKKGIAKKVNVLFTEDTMEIINIAKVFFDGNMTKYLETLIMEDYKKNKDLYDTLAKTKRV